MMTEMTFILLCIALAAIIFFTRAFPFLFAKQLRKSAFAQVLARALPLAIMLLLTLHGIEGSTQLPPALIGVAVTAFIHLLFKQPIISIFAGTATYVILIR